MVRLDDVIDELLRHDPNADTHLVRRAYVFSAAAHRGQTRRNGEPYLVHPLEVSHIVSELRLDTHSVCAALLHDTVEDTVATVEDIDTKFGADVAFLVDGLTKLEKINFESAEEAQAENFRKMILAMSRDLRVIVVKLADRLHNMRTLVHLKPAKQRKIAQETLEIYAPLANRLGLGGVKSELEDLCFKHLFSDEYKAVADRIKKTRRERHAYIDKVIAQLGADLESHGVKAEVSGRPKHLWSIRQKMRKTGRDLDNLFDILAFRIIVQRVSECYESLGLVHSLWKPVPGRFKDYIALPKQNNYQSLHTSVMGPETEVIELQIRTEEMHQVAELGVAAHWNYKERGRSSAQEQDERFSWLRQLLEWQRDLKDPNDFMETVKCDLFADEVYVFTPRGDVKAFPRGATPVDFAYAIHTEVGHETTGSKVNGTLVPLRYELQNGDIVEILRTSGHRPSKDWLKLVKTGRAATKIRSFIRQEARDRAITVGQEMLEQELKKYGTTFNRLKRAGKLMQAARKFKFKSLNELQANIGYGKVRIDQMLSELLPPEKLETGPKNETAEGALKKFIKRVLPKEKPGIVVDGIDDIATHFPKCCAPVHGDPIVGFVTRGRGITVHRRDCARVLDYEPECRLEVRWDTRSKQSTPVDIRIQSVDVPGLLASISQSFHNAGVNISAVNCRTTDDHRAINRFTVLVNDIDQLNRVIHDIEKIDGVLTVERRAD